MKKNSIKLLSALSFGFALLFANQTNAQTAPSKTTGKTTEGTAALVAPKERKGQFTRETDCVDLFVRKGCVTYSIAIPEDKKKTPEKVKVCAQGNPADAKPVNLCKKGADKITVDYEKSSDADVIEFVPRPKAAKVIKADQKAVRQKEN